MKISTECTCAGVLILALLVLVPGNIAIAEPPHPSGTAKADDSPVVGAWPRLDDAERAAAVADLKEYASTTAAELNSPLRMFETKYFLFYSDLPDKEAQKWAGLLDKMYARLAEMFGVQKGDNIWQGKALVFVFSNPQAYRKYEQEMLHTDPGDSAGMCHTSANGHVRIAFYRQKDDGLFAHVLVHESVHGFVHRFRTPVRVPSWANEGLAETIATELVPQVGRREEVKNHARSQLKMHENRMLDFFDLEHIEAWQYPVAEELCTFMIQSDKQKYVNFIRGLKDGAKWDECLASQFKAPPDRLVRAFGQWLGVRELAR